MTVTEARAQHEGALAHLAGLRQRLEDARQERLACKERLGLQLYEVEDPLLDPSGFASATIKVTGLESAVTRAEENCRIMAEAVQEAETQEDLARLRAIEADLPEAARRLVADFEQAALTFGRYARGVNEISSARVRGYHPRVDLAAIQAMIRDLPNLHRPDRGFRLVSGHLPLALFAAEKETP